MAVRKRKKIKLRYKAERVLFSDVLPYELPVIFSNRYFYRFLLENGVRWEDGKITYRGDIREGAKEILLLLMNCKNDAELNSNEIEENHLQTIPFNYRIKHKPTKARVLSVVHPANQIRMVGFYEKYKSLILYYCNRDDFSIRHPKKVACYFYYRDKLHHQLLGRKADSIELFFNEYENLKTYFSYQKYTNIYKFYEDHLYQRAEKKFPHLLKFDIQSCFDSIYTHSITWATNGGKDIYKMSFRSKDKTFGSEFDEVMQKMNYNETNGIVIGPEFSRIFAEIIVQHIDCVVKERLEKCGYRMNVHYLCCRYVDDYFFYYEKEEVKNKALQLFDEVMIEYKLSINDSKTINYERPFITEITMAKQQIDSIVLDFLSFQDGLKEDDEDKDGDDAEEAEDDDLSKDEQCLEKALNSNAKLYVKSTKLIAKYKAVLKAVGVENKDVVNYALAQIERKLVSVLNRFDRVFKQLCMGINDQDREKECREKKEKLEHMLSEYLINLTDVVFFLYADCKRVNTTLKLMKIMNAIIIYLDNDYYPQKDEKVQRFSNTIRDVVFRNIQKEIDMVFRTSMYEEETPLETLYLLITIKSMRDKYRINQQVIDEYLGIEYDKEHPCKIKSAPKMNALVIILLMYYYGASNKYFKQRIGLISIIRDKFRNVAKENRRRSAELVLLFLDLLACPYLRSKDRVRICKLMDVSPQAQQKMEKYLRKKRYMFTRWTNVNLTKELGAKVSLEVYS